MSVIASSIFVRVSPHFDRLDETDPDAADQGDAQEQDPTDGGGASACNLRTATRLCRALWHRPSALGQIARASAWCEFVQK